MDRATGVADHSSTLADAATPFTPTHQLWQQQQQHGITFMVGSLCRETLGVCG